MSYGKLRNFVSEIDVRTEISHEFIIDSGRADGPPGQAATIEATGSLSYIKFDGAAGTQKIYGTFKVPANYVRNPSIHVHWTKSSLTDVSTQNVRWILTYSVFDGDNNGLFPSSVSGTIDDTYDDNGTTTKHIYRTTDFALDNVQGEHYVTISLEKGTPDSNPISNPAVVSVDFTFSRYLNKTA